MKQVPCDVLVVGAGVSGTVAAVAAAREGARTILVEQEAYLGGIGYAGLLQHICGLYVNGETVPTETLNEGIPREITTLLAIAAPGKTIKKKGQVYVLPYASADLQTVLSSLCAEEKTLTVLRETAAIAVKADQGTVHEVNIKGPDAEQAITPKMVIDCTGNGNIAAMSGAAFELAPMEKRQLAGYIFHIKGLRKADQMLAVKIPYHLDRAVKQNIFSSAIRFTTFLPGDAEDEGYCKMSVDGEEGVEREVKAKKDADAVVQYLASVLPEFKNAVLADASLKVLDREGRRVCCEYTLTEQDILSAKKFPDGVVKNAWPMELWDPSHGTIYQYVPKGDYYEIPFRCMIVKGFGNLLCAGRCISVTHAALGSTRIMGACMALGEQAGKAAAYHIQYGKYPY